MIKISSTGIWIKNSRGVCLKLPWVSLNSHCNWSLFNSRKECCRWFGSYLIYFIYHYFTFFGFACFIHCGIWIFCFRFKRVSLSIKHSSICPSSIATITNCVTINKLLFRKTLKISWSNKITTLNRSDCRECPTWSALSLIFNWVNSSFSSPVNTISFYILKRSIRSSCKFFWCLKSKHFFVFIFSPGWEQIMSSSKSVLRLSINFLNIRIYLLKDCKSEVIFFLGSIRNSILRKMTNKLVLQKGYRWWLLTRLETNVRWGFAEIIHI